MKLIAHRGWSAGENENTLAAFARAARESSLSGVEFDVRRAAGRAVVSHDPPSPAVGAPALAEALSLLAPTTLELFMEIKEAGLAAECGAQLVAHKVAERSVVFAFEPVARSFAWGEARPVRLGVIVLYPWDLARIVRAYAPDVLFLGWDERVWTRMAFRAWWSLSSLERLASRYRASVVAGVVQRQADLQWLERQRIYAAVADMDLLGNA